MTTRTKSALLLFVTLAVGMLLGVLGASALQNRRAEKIRDARERGGVVRLMENVIQPVDEAQRAQLRAALEKSEDRFSAARRECRENLGAQRDSLLADLDLLLNPDQRERVREWLSRDWSRNNGRSRSKKGRSGPRR